MDWWRVARMVLGGVILLCVWLGAVAALAGRDVPGFSGDLAGMRDDGVPPGAMGSAAVRVRAEGCNGSVSGSGFVVEGQLFTNRHVVGDTQVVAVTAAETPQISVDVPVLGRSSRLDAAVAGPVPEGLAVEQVAFADSDARVGDEVWLLGWVDGQVRRQQATVHLLTDGGAYGVDGQVMLIDPATTFGFSGGPVLNGEGEVVAMLQSVDLVTSLTLAIPVSELREPAIEDIYGAGSSYC